MVVADKCAVTHGKGVVCPGFEPERDVEGADVCRHPLDRLPVEGDGRGIDDFHGVSIIYRDVAMEQQVYGRAVGDSVGAGRGRCVCHLILHIVGARDGHDCEKPQGKKIFQDFHFRLSVKISDRCHFSGFSGMGSLWRHTRMLSMAMVTGTFVSSMNGPQLTIIDRPAKSSLVILREQGFM